jgi:hypothetical protein
VRTPVIAYSIYMYPNNIIFCVSWLVYAKALDGVPEARIHIVRIEFLYTTNPTQTANGVE